MLRTALTTAALAAVLALGTTIDDHSADQAMADNLEAAQQQARHEATYQAAVQRLCGPNAAWMELADGAIECTDKRGRLARRVVLVTTTTPEASP